MSSRLSPRFVIALASISLIAGGAGFAISACSSSSSDTGGGADAAPEGSADAGRVKVDAGPPDEPIDAAKPETTEQCFARCDKEHMGSLAKYNAVDTCWGDKCNDPCVDGKGFDAGDQDAEALDGGRVTDGGGLCGTTFGSGQNIGCDDCTTINCCAEWRGCYNDTDCKALEGCYQDCP